MNFGIAFFEKFLIFAHHRCLVEYFAFFLLVLLTLSLDTEQDRAEKEQNDLKGIQRQE